MNGRRIQPILRRFCPSFFATPQGEDVAASSRGVVLYTRSECCLCDEAVKILRNHDLNVRLIDIDADPALAAQFGNCVPVVEMDGKIRFRGRVNEVLLRRLLRRQREGS